MLASFVLSLVAAALPDDAAKSDLGAVLKKLEGAKSYHCDYSAGAGKSDGGGEKSDGDDAAGGKPGRDGWSIDFEHGKPVHLKSGNVELFRDDKKLAFRDAKAGKWVPLEPGAGGANGAKKGVGGGAAADDPEAKSRMMAQRMALEIEKLSLPHVVARDLAGKCTDVTRSEAGGKVTYVGKLHKDAARELSGSKDQRPPGREGREGRPGREGREGREGRDGQGGGKRERPNRGGGGEGGDDGDDGESANLPFAANQDAPPERGGKAAAGGRGEPEVDGSVTVVVAGGVVTSLGVEISFKGPQSRVVRKSWQLSGIEKTSVEVPAEAAAALAGK
jgi:hypothetical protein